MRGLSNLPPGCTDADIERAQGTDRPQGRTNPMKGGSVKKVLVYKIEVVTEPTQANPQEIVQAIAALIGVKSATVIASNMRKAD